MIGIDRLDHLVLTVADLGRSLAFYTDVLGMTEETFDAGRKALRFGGQKINLHELGHEFEPKARSPTPGSADLCFLLTVPIGEALMHLAERGVKPELGPVPRTGAVGAMLSIYLRDPDGNLIELSSAVPA